MLLMVEKDIRSGTFHVVHKFAKAKNKYMKHYDPSRGSSCTVMSVIYLYGWEM